VKTEADIEKMLGYIEKSIKPIDRERVCPHCHTGFYAQHLNKRFCSDKCADTYYNERIRPLMQAQKYNQHLEEIEKRMEEFKKSIPTHSEIINRSIGILDRLTIDKFSGTVYPATELFDLGLDFKVYSFREKILTKEGECYALYMGRYRLTNIDNKQIRIEKLLPNSI
jgi:hypothetical protein